MFSFKYLVTRPYENQMFIDIFIDQCIFTFLI